MLSGCITYLVTQFVVITTTRKDLVWNRDKTSVCTCMFGLGCNASSVLFISTTVMHVITRMCKGMSTTLTSG